MLPKGIMYTHKSSDSLPVLYISFLLLAVTIFLSACSKENEGPDPKPNPACFSDNKITISDIQGIPEGIVFDKVRIEISGLAWSVIDVIEAEFKNGEAVIELPAAYPAEELCKVSRSEASDNYGYWPAEADNLDARVAGFENFDVYDGDKKVGRVYLTDWEGAGHSSDYKSFIYYHYTNEPFSLSGYNYTLKGNRVSFKYQLSFQEGWNAYAKVNSIDSGPTTCTTTISDELDTRWRFELQKFN